MFDAELTRERIRLLGWGERIRRDLPWRRTRDPWRILVSEVMLQQTGADRVVERWERFVARWPDTASCASSPLSEVLVEWQGLGYPRRARNLHLSASIVEADLGGRFPDTLDGLLALPGVGPYTARAVLAFAYEHDVAVLDTNVGRVLARRAGERLTPRVAQDRADEWLATGRAWEWNQSLLDLGAIVCRPAAPDCGACPVAPGCRWHSAGRPEPDPARRSAAVSRPQAPYAGSRRQRRGVVLAALGRDAPVPAGCEDVVASLVDDGLVEPDGRGGWRLPGPISPPGTPGSAD